MYISNHYYEISIKPVRDGFEVDDLIAPAISVLNKLGYKTAFCCSGHPDCRYFPEHGYISFWFGETPPEYLPAGWYWEEDGLMQYEYENTEREELRKEIIHVMEDLHTWAERLPDLNA